MSKDKTRVVTVNLPERLLAQIDAASPNRSDLVRQALESWFHRAPSDVEVALALEIVFRAAQTKRGEVVE